MRNDVEEHLKELASQQPELVLHIGPPEKRLPKKSMRNQFQRETVMAKITSPVLDELRSKLAESWDERVKDAIAKDPSYGIGFKPLMDLPVRSFSSHVVLWNIPLGTTSDDRRLKAFSDLSRMYLDGMGSVKIAGLTTSTVGARDDSEYRDFPFEGEKLVAFKEFSWPRRRSRKRGGT